MAGERIRVWEHLKILRTHSRRRPSFHRIRGIRFRQRPCRCMNQGSLNELLASFAGYHCCRGPRGSRRLSSSVSHHRVSIASGQRRRSRRVGSVSERRGVTRETPRCPRKAASPNGGYPDSSISVVVSELLWRTYNRINEKTTWLVLGRSFVLDRPDRNHANRSRRNQGCGG